MELATEIPVYCSKMSCARFVPAGNITADVATCLKCNSKTYSMCQNKNHNGACPKDPTVQLLMDVASEKKMDTLLSVSNYGGVTPQMLSYAVRYRGEAGRRVKH